MIAAVLSHAVDLEVLEVNPIASVRDALRRKMRSKRGRASADTRRHIRPLERPEDVEAFTRCSRGVGGRLHALDLLQLDAGLRLGEALAVRWCDVEWGRDASDLSRAIHVCLSLSRGEHLGPPKAGRTRRVALSRRLRTLLRELQLAASADGDEERVVGEIDTANYRHRHFARTCELAGLGKRRPKDLRDTFASQLLTVGVQLGYVSTQLGHADVAVTARHYARWAGGDVYRSPLVLLPGEVPADFLARLGKAEIEPAARALQRGPSSDLERRYSEVSVESGDYLGGR